MSGIARRSGIPLGFSVTVNGITAVGSERCGSLRAKSFLYTTPPAPPDISLYLSDAAATVR